MDDRKLEAMLIDAFDGVRCEQDLKDKTLDNIMNGQAKRRQRVVAEYNPRFSPMMKGLAAAVCCVIAVVATFGAYTTPAAAICLDGDMSMRLTVNRFDRVIDVKTYNANAKSVLSQLKNSGKGAVGKQLLKDVMAADGASDVEVYIISENEKLSGAILADVATGGPTMIASSGQALVSNDGVLCQVVQSKVDSAGNADADKNKMTYQRYELYKKVQGLGLGLTEAQVRDMSLGDLRAIVAKAELGGSGVNGNTAAGGNVAGNVAGNIGQGSGTIGGDYNGGIGGDADIEIVPEDNADIVPGEDVEIVPDGDNEDANAEADVVPGVSGDADASDQVMDNGDVDDDIDVDADENFEADASADVEADK